jgi:hypothetical protein
MTIGIYKLNFDGCSKVYIGSSQQIEERFRQHIRSLKNNTANNKMLEAYKEYGLPTLEIIYECSIIELEEAENYFISEYFADTLGLNINKYNKQAPVMAGENNGFSKYKLEDYFCVLYYLGFHGYSNKYISEITGVSSKVISHISLEEAHTYLKDMFPKLYLKMQENTLKGRRSASSLGIKYPKIKCPNGIIYEIEHVTNFARTHNLLQPKLHEVLTGSRNSTRGWSLA